MVRIKLFAMLRDKAGTENIDLPLPEGGRVSDMVDVIIEKYPGLREPFSSRNVLVVVNQRYASVDTELSDGDELALLPPVSGG